MKVLFIFGGMDDVQNIYSTSVLTKRIYEDGKLVGFEDFNKIHNLPTSADTLRFMKKPMSPGDAFTNLSGET